MATRNKPRTPRVLAGTPAEHGFSFPPEWAPQSGTWLSWPRPEGISFPARYHTIPPALARIVDQIARRQVAHINVPNENWESIVRQDLSTFGCALANVRFHRIPTNESWCRDHGPAFVTRRARSGARQAAIVDWGFNAWGGKYPPYDADDAVPTRVAQELAGSRGFRGVFYPKAKGRPVVMEGGAVEFNGRGCVLTTEQCLLNPNRNPHLTRRDIERALRDCYGQTHVLWLGDGIEGDDTDGHVDDLARFVDARTIAVALEDDPRDANHRVLRENDRRARLLRDQDGRGFDILTLPMPGVVQIQGQRLPATYLNFLFVNGALLVPTFGHPNDRVALARLREFYGRRREVVGIDCRDVIWGLGAIHCLTQQVPRW